MKTHTHRRITHAIQQLLCQPIINRRLAQKHTMFTALLSLLLLILLNQPGLVEAQDQAKFVEVPKLENPLASLIDVKNSSMPHFADIDNDGDFDVFIGIADGTVKYYENTGNVTYPKFEERIEQHNPLNEVKMLRNFSPRPTLLDIDHDGDLDAFIMGQVEGPDSNGKFIVYPLIKYYENTGTASHPEFKEHTNTTNPLSKLELNTNSIPNLLFFDNNLDGDLDLFIQYLYNTIYYENTGSISKPYFIGRSTLNDLFIETLKIGTDNTPILVDINKNNVLDIFIVTSDGTVMYYENINSSGGDKYWKYQDQDQDNPFINLVGITREFAPSWVDLDNDGDLDAFIKTSDGTTKYYKNTSHVNQATFNKLRQIFVDDIDTFFTNPTLVDIDNDSDLDAFIGTNHGTVNYYENTGTINQPPFIKRTGQDNPLMKVKVESYASPSLVDIDNDNDFDAFIGIGDGRIRYYENIGKIDLPYFVERTGQNNPLNSAKVEWRSIPKLIDFDADNDLDAFISGIVIDDLKNENNTVQIFNIVKYYENIGTSKSPTFVDHTEQNDFTRKLNAEFLNFPGTQVELDSVNILGVRPPGLFFLFDIEDDGDLDALVNIGIFMIYYENTGNPENQFISYNLAEHLEFISNITDDTPADIDTDGDLDTFTVTNDYGGVIYYETTTLAEEYALPNPYASPNNGIYNSKREVSLNCLDCEKIYYTLDGTRPTTDSTEYALPLEMTANTTLKFLAVDAQGNPSQIRTEQYVIDTEAPELEITWPEKDSNIMSLTSIEGTVNSKNGTELDRIEVQVTNGHLYFEKSSKPFSTSLTWLLIYKNYEPVSASLTSLPVSFNEKWNYNIGTVSLPIGTYTIKARAFDKAGNVAEEQITVNNLVYTYLSIESNPTLLQNELLKVEGKLSRYPNTNEPLSKKMITITTTASDGTETTTYAVTDEKGNYTQYLSGFTHKGIYTLKASFEGDEILLASPSSETQVRVGSSAGYAILIQGQVQGDERGALTYNKTLNRVYRKLKLMGFTDDNIRYFNYNTEQDIDGDGQNDDIFDVHQKMAIKTAIEEWARDRMNGSPAPLYIVMVDHGALETFYIYHENDEKNDDAITLNALNQWLDTLESGLNQTALEEPRVIIMGACYSGSFIHASSKEESLSKKGRIIITSADKGESSSRGFMKEPDGILTGELFIEQLFDGLVYGDPELNDGVPLNFKAAFEQATQSIEKFTNNPLALRSLRFADHAVQHPLLDDNGDGQGNNMLVTHHGDGQQVESLFLGVSPKEGINSDKRPAYILEVTPTLRLNETQTAATLFLKANQSDKVARTGSGATVRIRPPSKRFDAQDGSEQITFEDLETVDLIYKETTGRFETTYTGFNEAGKYELFYTVRDATTQDMAPIQRSLVYNKVDSDTHSRVRSPTELKLRSPADNTQTRTVLIFDWADSKDFDNGPISYTLSIANDKAFEKVIYQQEELPVSMTYVENAENKPCGKRKNACLEDNSRYYWKVEAINNVGEGTVSDIWTFTTKDANAPPGIASVQVNNALDGTPIENVDITLDQNHPEDIIADQGRYIFSLPSIDELYSMWLNVPGYLPRRRARAKTDFIAFEIVTGQATEIQVFLEPCTDFSCEEIQAAQFSFETQLLTIPTLKVPEVGEFSVQLQGDDSFTFTVLMDKVNPLSETTDYVAYFSPETGQLFLPRLKVVKPSGEVALYKVTMKRVNSEVLQFELVDALEIH